MNNTCPKVHPKKAIFKTYLHNRNTANSPMTEQFVTPPARVWEKIERILDQQDKDRSSNIFFSRPSPHTKNRFSFCVAAVSVTALAGLVWVCR